MLGVLAAGTATIHGGGGIAPNPSARKVSHTGRLVGRGFDIVAPSQEVGLCASNHHGRVWRWCNVFIVVWRQPLAQKGIDAQ